MNKRLRLLLVVFTLFTMLGIGIIPSLSSSAKTSPILVNYTQQLNDTKGELICAICGRDMHRVDVWGNRVSGQSQLAKALGLTICIQCWDVLSNSEESYQIPNIATFTGTGDNTTYLRGDGIWATPPSGGYPTWGSITGDIATQTDLSGILSGKLSAITGTELDNIFSSNGLLKRTGAGTYTVDDSAYLTSFTELDPVFVASVAHGISSGDITNWNNKLSSFTELDPEFLASVAYGIQSANITNWNNKLSSITGNELDNIFSSNGLLKRTGTGTYIVDNNIYLTDNQNISLSGDASGSGTTSIAITNTGLKDVALPTLATGYLYYNGSAFAFQTPTGGSSDPVTTIDMSEEFIAGLLTTGNIGNLSWSFLTTAPTYQASVANHLGIRRLTTSTTINTVNAFYLGSAANNDNIQFGDLCDFTFVIRISDISTMAAFVGAMDAMTTAVGNQDRYGFSFIAGTDTYWMMTTGSGSASTRTATNITVVANTWYTLRVVRTSTGVDYYINGVSKGTITTTLPDTALSFGFHLQTLAAAARYLDCDFFRMTLGVTR